MASFIKNIISLFDTKDQQSIKSKSDAQTDEHENRMVMDQFENNSIPAEFDYLKELIHYRLNQYLPIGKRNQLPSVPPWDQWTLQVPQVIQDEELNQDEVAILILALAPHVLPDLLDQTIQQHLDDRADFPKIGGVRGTNFRGFLPTAQTALFLLGGDDLEKRFQLQTYFLANHFFNRNQILWLEEVKEGEPSMSARIIISQELVDQFISGQVSSPKFGTNFPARHINTLMDWEDLILPDETIDQVRELETWVKLGAQLMACLLYTSDAADD